MAAGHLRSDRERFLAGLLFVMLLAWISYVVMSPVVDDAISRLRV